MTTQFRTTAGDLTHTTAFYHPTFADPIDDHQLERSAEPVYWPSA